MIQFEREDILKVKPLGKTLAICDKAGSSKEQGVHTQSFCQTLAPFLRGADWAQQALAPGGPLPHLLRHVVGPVECVGDALRQRANI